MLSRSGIAYLVCFIQVSSESFAVHVIKVANFFETWMKSLSCSANHTTSKSYKIVSGVIISTGVGSCERSHETWIFLVLFFKNVYAVLYIERIILKYLL